MDDRPVILLVSEEHADYLLDEFGRYARDYDLRTAHSAAEAARWSSTSKDSSSRWS